MSFKKQMKLYGNLFWFYVPAVILVIIFNYVPMTGIIMAFKKNPNLLGSSSAIQSGWGSRILRRYSPIPKSFRH